MTNVPNAPHLLYVAWGYPPSRGSGVYRALATANEFASRGWRVTVLTANRETFLTGTGTDPALEAKIDPSIEIVRIPFEAPAYLNDITTWSRMRALAPELWNGIQSSLSRRTFPERGYGQWCKPLEEAAVRIHRNDPVTLTLGTANPHVDFTPGRRLHQEFGIPYVMDYRDAWQLDVFSGNRMTSAGGRIDRIERELMRDALEVWFVNEPIQEWHAAVHPESASKMRVVANGFDSEMAAFDSETVRRSDDGLVFGYVGTMSSHVPMGKLAAAWEIARGRSPLLAKSRIDLYGYLDHSGVPNEQIAALLGRNADQSISYRGPVSRGDIRRVYSTFDALLLVLGTGRYVTSGKVYEYLATGLPIASIHDPKNAASSVLTGYPEWFPAESLDVDEIATTLVKTADAAAAQTAENQRHARSWAERYERSHQLAPRIRHLLGSLPAAGVGE